MNVCSALMLALVVFAAHSQPPATEPGAPAGRPPIGPLERVEPRVYDVRFSVQLNTPIPRIDASQRRSYQLKDAPIVMPIIYQGAYSAVASDSVRARLWLGGGADDSLPQRFRIDSGKAFNTHLAVLPIAEFHGQALRWEIEQRVQVWDAKVKSEREAAAVAWPSDWPEEVKDALRPQMFIESEAPIFARAVEQVSQGQLRMVPPYYAAKDLIRYCVDEIRVSGSASVRNEVGVLMGMEMQGAQKAASDGIGTEHDLVCVCVAMLRAGGIPARPVVGVFEDRESRRNDFISWGEFYLPQAGWVVFDPKAMRGKVRHRDVHDAWPGFGTIDDLNERIPLAYDFIPAATVQVPERPAIWGWDPRPGGDPSTEQAISITIISRGRGVEDPGGER